jgi:excisionase family DNA binding protein
MTAITNIELLADGLERISEAARYLGVSRSLVYRLINTGVLPSVRIGRNRRVPIRAVRDLASDNLVVLPSRGKQA